MRAELAPRNALEATDQHLAELLDEVGDPTTRQRRRADAIARKVRDRMIKVG